MRLPLAVFVAAGLSTPAFAQSAPAGSPLPSPEELQNRDTLTVGLGAAILPDYDGSNNYRVIPAGGIRGRFHGFAFSTRGTYLYVNAVRGNAKVQFDAGPAVGVRLNTLRHIEDPVVKLLPKRNVAVEVGAFAGVSIHQLTNPYDTLAFRVDFLHDVANAHQSTTISPSVEFTTPLSRTTYVGAHVGAEFAGDGYADYYFTVTPADSVKTGGVLPPFKANGGIKDWKVGLLANQSLSGDLLHGFSLFGLGEYSHLVGDFRRSPIVSQRGSAGQWLGSVGLAYTW